MLHCSSFPYALPPMKVPSLQSLLGKRMSKVPMPGRRLRGKTHIVTLYVIRSPRSWQEGTKAALEILTIFASAAQLAPEV